MDNRIFDFVIETLLENGPMTGYELFQKAKPHMHHFELIEALRLLREAHIISLVQLTKTDDVWKNVLKYEVVQ